MQGCARRRIVFANSRLSIVKLYSGRYHNGLVLILVSSIFPFLVLHLQGTHLSSPLSLLILTTAIGKSPAVHLAAFHNAYVCRLPCSERDMKRDVTKGGLARLRNDLLVVHC